MYISCKIKLNLGYPHTPSLLPAPCTAVRTPLSVSNYWCGKEQVRQLGVRSDELKKASQRYHRICCQNFPPQPGQKIIGVWVVGVAPPIAHADEPKGTNPFYWW